MARNPINWLTKASIMLNFMYLQIKNYLAKIVFRIKTRMPKVANTKKSNIKSS
jgi:hypothetical protein